MSRTENIDQFCFFAEYCGGILGEKPCACKHVLLLQGLWQSNSPFDLLKKDSGCEIGGKDGSMCFHGTPFPEFFFSQIFLLSKVGHLFAVGAVFAGYERSGY